jgi:predicted phosphatase
MNELLNIKNQREFGQDYVKILTKLLIAAGKKSSSSLINSLSYNLQSTATEIQIILEAEDYFKYVDEGRRPGKYPPISAISKWASIKGIPQGAVFPIAKKIFKFGIKPTHIGDKMIKEIENSVGKIEDDVAENVENIIINNFKNIK